MSKRKFLEGCWTEQGGIHLRIEEDEHGRAYIMFEEGPGGKVFAEVSIAQFRRDRTRRPSQGRAMMPNPTPDPAALKAVTEAREALAKLVADYKHANYQPETGFEHMQMPEVPYPWHFHRWAEPRLKAAEILSGAAIEVCLWLCGDERGVLIYVDAYGALCQAQVLIAAGHPEDALAEAKRAERVLTGQSVAEQAQGRP